MVRERSLFMAGGGEPEGGGSENLATYCRGGATFFLAYFFGGAIFFNALFLLTFSHESDITCIITVVGAQQQHKGMFFFKHYGGGQIFPTVSWGGVLFFAYRFCHPPPSPPTAININNERFLKFVAAAWTQFAVTLES